MTLQELAVARQADGGVAQGFEVCQLDGDGREHRGRLGEAWATRFEEGLPVRKFTPHKGQRHLSGLWWSATTGRHLGFESWLERDHAMLLDFDPAVVGIASQPFRLHWVDEAGESVSHVPDYFARRADGSAVVVDCRPVERRPSPDVAKFEATARACGSVGWDFRLVGASDAVRTVNVRWLAGYRHPRHHLPEVASRLRELFRQPAPLIAGAQAVGDPIAVLPVLFHLLWRHELLADVSVPLHQHTNIRTAAA